MLFGKSKRKISHNLIISKYFDEESAKIQNQYFVRNVAEEFSVISIGFGGFFVMINPCSFDIEFDSDTFTNSAEVNLVEVEKFGAKAATVFRIFEQNEIPELDIDYLNSKITDKQKRELKSYLKNVKGTNKQYDIAMGELGTDLSTIKIDVEALSLANYKRVSERSGKQMLEIELAEKKKELASINEAIKVAKDIEKTVDLATELRNMSDDEYEAIMQSIAKNLDAVEVNFDTNNQLENDYEDDFNDPLTILTDSSKESNLDNELSTLFDIDSLFAEIENEVDFEFSTSMPQTTNQADELDNELAELSSILDSLNTFASPEELFKDFE